MNKSEMLELSYAQLQRMKVDLDEVISQKRVEERVKAREELERRAKELGFDAEDLFSGTKPKAKAPAKYAHPENSSKTWSGRGRQPNWMKEHLENGGKLEELEL